MNRDKEEFELFWKLSGFADRVVYQVGLHYEGKSSGFMIIDESDTLIFNNPDAFLTLLSKCRVICLTATPDDNDRKGVEKQVLTTMKLSQFSYGFPAECTAPAAFTETKSLSGN